MKLSFQDRIAFYFMMATAAVVFVLLTVLYSIVNTTVYNHLDTDLDIEARKHFQEIEVSVGSIQFADKSEWLEREHKTIEVNPVFIQIADAEGKLFDKSPNLKLGHLIFDPNQPDFSHFNTTLSSKSIRQVQIPVRDQGKTVGYLMVALALEDSQMVLSNLKDVILIASPIILILLFFLTRFITGRSIQPVRDITDTASRITRENLNERILPPANKDELHTLVVTINELLDRMENAILREKQFTSDASHQLRTPLAVMKGTLEVMIRRPRDQDEYEETVTFCIQEIDHMSRMVEQLLLLARYESQKASVKWIALDLAEAISDVLRRLQPQIQEKMLKINLAIKEKMVVNTDPHMLDIILENILSNAVKYSTEYHSIDIAIEPLGQRIHCTFKDHGIGIKEAEMPRIFDKFYRVDAIQHTTIDGTGLGLSIVKRLCTLLDIEINVSSNPGQGTAFTMIFPSVGTHF